MCWKDKLEYYTTWKTLIIGIVWSFYFLVFSELREATQTILGDGINSNFGALSSNFQTTSWNFF